MSGVGTPAWVRASGLCGILVPIVAFSCIGVAIALSPWFSWLGNALSDLGAFSSPVAPIFNTGLIVAGILAIMFSFGLMRQLRASRLGLIGATFTLLTSISLALIGAFPENVRPHHFLASVAFFAFSLIMLLALGPTWLRRAGRADRVLGAFMVASAIIGALAWGLWGPLGLGPGIAIPETISAGLVSICVMAVGAEIATGRL